jgi:dinuclear metal center YbgI/SA1388 family protein
MTNMSQIIEMIENFAPPALASSWDNSGWQVNLGNKSVNKILLALTVTEDILNQAINNDCDLIISHHPMLFEKFNCISIENKATLLAIKAIQNNIQVYSAHTNLDSTKGGIADKLAELLGLENIKIPDYIEDSRFIRIGELKEVKSIEDFANEVKIQLNLSHIKLVNNCKRTLIKKVAVVPGSGASFIPYLKDIDALVTGDIKYHNALEAENFAVIDAGHYETEIIIFPTIKGLLSQIGIEVLIAEEKSVWEII